MGAHHKAALLILLFLFNGLLYAQTKRDTVRPDTGLHLNEISVHGYLSERPLLSTPASVGVLGAAELRLQPDNSLVTVMNTVPGVRMEERSPGSYRLSIRGSLLRSPFGVRDVKIYFDEIPLTDAGGNTYLNAIDVNSVQGIEILKGPDGSLFGANSGGVVLISPVNKHADSSFVSGGFNGGSYSLLHEYTAAQIRGGANQFNVSQAYQNYDGYRANSAMQRNYIQLADALNYGYKNQVRAVGFYSDLNYQTPGGLTLDQELTNPQWARTATKTTASAADLQAHVSSKMFFGGLVNETRLSPSLRNVLTVFGTHVDFTNPSFTTYEQRREGTYGLRTYFELLGAPHETIAWKINLGFEWQQTNSAIGNYGNNLGDKDTVQTQDNIRTNQNFVFTRFEANINKRLEVEAALSLNNYQYQFQNLYPLAQNAYIARPFNAQLMPRLALSYQLNPNFAWRASVSRGYSTPTTAEIRPTDHTINTLLQAQDGWNYETGLRLKDNAGRFFLDVSAFYYRLNNAIVMRMHPNETSYYVNAGGTNQPGLEAYFSGWLIRQKNSGIIRGLQLNESYTYSKFTFRNYQDATTTYNYSGNNLTGVPIQVTVTNVQILLPRRFYLFAQYNFTDRLPLNDANTVYADSYSLVEAKAGWKHRLNTTAQLELYAGVDNLLNQNYSLGNDLNATANRYYNPAPLRNFFGGANVRF